MPNAHWYPVKRGHPVKEGRKATNVIRTENNLTEWRAGLYGSMAMRKTLQLSVSLLLATALNLRSTSAHAQQRVVRLQSTNETRIDWPSPDTRSGTLAELCEHGANSRFRESAKGSWVECRLLQFPSDGIVIFVLKTYFNMHAFVGVSRGKRIELQAHIAHEGAAGTGGNAFSSFRVLRTAWRKMGKRHLLLIETETEVVDFELGSLEGYGWKRQRMTLCERAPATGFYCGTTVPTRTTLRSFTTSKNGLLCPSPRKPLNTPQSWCSVPTVPCGLNLSVEPGMASSTRLARCASQTPES